MTSLINRIPSISTIFFLVIISYTSFGRPNNFIQTSDTIQVFMGTIEKMPTMRNNIPGYLLNKEKTKAYKGIPNDLGFYGIMAFDFQPESKRQIKQSVAVLSAIRGGKKLLICDANNDKDFSNDPVQEYDLGKLAENEDKLDLLPVTRINYQYDHTGKVHDRVLSVKIRPFNSSYGYRDSLMHKLQVYMIGYQEREGYFQLGNKEYKLSLPNGRYLGGDFHDAFAYLAEKGKENLKIDPLLKIGDIFSLNNARVKLHSSSEFGDTVTIVVMNAEKAPIGLRVGEHVRPFKFKDISSGKLINSAQSKKYVLLDFWGTWCVPCIEGLPELKAFREEHKNNLNIISVAYDVEEQKVKDFVKKRELTWIHKFENRKSLKDTDLAKVLSVECFPTFILLGPNHEILVRGCGPEALQEADLVLGGIEKTRK